MLDCKIVGGEIIDGTGSTRFRADVAIRDGCIVSIDGPGVIDEPAARVVDASGLIVAPGFIDTHTHHDAQVSWDPYLTPSPLHGVTSVIGGNCGFTVAPIDDSAGDYVMRMLARVEGMPLEALRAGLAWDWSSFGDWLDRMETGGLGVNAGFLVGHSTIRRLAMGSAAVGEVATEPQLAAMAASLDESLAAGALGLSSSLALSHHDGDGAPVPSRFATHQELVALARIVGHHPGTVVALNPGVSSFSEADISLMAEMSLAAGRVLNWNALIVDATRADAVGQALAASDGAALRGARVLAQVAHDPRHFYLSFMNGFLLDTLDGWAPLFGLDHVERRRLLADPEVLRNVTDWAGMTFVETTAIDRGPDRARRGETLAGRTVAHAAGQRSTDAFDTLLDVVVEDDLRTVFMPRPTGDDEASWRMRADVWLDPRTVIGASDAGAHLDVASSFTYTTALVGSSVRQRGLLSLEAAVRELTDVARQVVGLRHRGRIAAGWFADVVIFDPDTVTPEPVHVRRDLPGGARRLFAGADGIHHVLVNGVAVASDGRLTGDRPGRVLRSGRDTETIALA
jgi:N-acyl-D-aspartate/D-glutamate deacylase